MGHCLKLYFLLLVSICQSTYAQNKVLSLNGNGGYVDLGGNVPIVGTQFSQELWIYPQQLDDAWHGFFGYQDPLTLGGSKRPPSIWLWQRTRIHYGFGDGSRWYSTNSSSVLKERDWNHVATTFDGSSYKLYVNGNEVHSYLGASNQTPIPLPIRWIGKVDNSFKGKIDEVRVWNIAKSGEKIKSQMKIPLSGTEDGLIGYWNFDAGNAKDLSDNMNDGKLVGDAQIIEIPIIISAESKTVNPKRQFELSININNIEEGDTLKFDLVFDSHLLQVRGIKRNYKNSSFEEPKISNLKGTISSIIIHNPSQVARKIQAKLITVTFYPLKQGKSQVKIKNIQLTKPNNGKQIPVEGISGSINIFPHGTINGSIKSYETDNPISGIIVLIKNSNYSHFLYTDDRGQFQAKHVPTGKITISTSMYKPQSEHIIAGQEKDYMTTNFLEFDIGESKTLNLKVKMIEILRSLAQASRYENENLVLSSRQIFFQMIMKEKRKQILVPALIQGLQSKDENVRDRAKDGLELIGLPDWMKDFYWLKQKVVPAVIVSILTAFGILHLLLFVFNIKSQEYLFHAILVGSTAGFVYLVPFKQIASPPISVSMFFVIFLSGLRFLYAIFYTTHLPRQFWYLLAVSAAFSIGLFLTNMGVMVFSGSNLWILSIPVIALFLEMIRVFICAILERREGAWVIGIGFSVFAIPFISTMFTSMRDYSSITGTRGLFYIQSIFYELPLMGMFGFLFSMSIYLARTVAKINKNLGIQNHALNESNVVLELTKERLVQINAKLVESEKETRKELQEAHDMQTSLLPESAPTVQGLQISGQNIAAKEVGGDFFDYLDTKQNLITIAVGDVSGKGLKGAMNAVMASGILRLSHKNESDVSQVISEVNASLCDSMEQDMNVTMILAQFDLQQKKMTLANAGQHAYPLLKRGTSVAPVKAKGLALGMIPSIPYKSLTLELQAGDLLLFMTDGITEPRNAEGLMYEESGRFHQVISQLSDDLTAEKVVERIIQDVIDYMVDEEERDDDITLVAVKVT